MRLTTPAIGSVPAVVLLSAAVLTAGAAAARQGPEPEIVFESPVDGEYVSGPTPIRVRIDAPRSQVPRTVSLYADGRLVCALERPPFECTWDAGTRVVEHVVRAVALMADGRRVAHSLQTKGVEYTETVDVNVVHITVTVTGGRGRFVRGLEAGDFRVYEDDVPQSVTHFASENVPLELVVSVDISGSMNDSMPVVRAAVKKFLSRLRQEDQVTVFGFNNTAFIIARPATDMQARLRAVDRLSAWGGTALYEAVIKASAQLGRQAGRRAIVVFTDGEDLNSRIPLETAERQLESGDAVLYAIGQGRAPGMETLRNVLERLTRKSGGRAFFEDLDELDDAFDSIIAELGNQYLIGYTPKDQSQDNRWRKIRVEIPGRDVRVRAREGYRTSEK